MNHPIHPPHGAPPPVSRRGFLRATAGGGAAIAAASLLPAGCATDYPAAALDGAELKALSPREYAVARGAAEALLVDVPVAPAVVAARIDGELSLVGDPVRADMKTVLTLLEHLTFLGGHVRPFTRLGPAQRRRYLEGWARSRFDLRRAAFQATRGFVYYFAYIDPATRTITGFQGPWPERLAIPVEPIDFGEVA
ncbi:MAG TPA: twin-arginine translocation signal domain-containing protein [Longimicrobiales bacterium]|nr:twin-arginine translocation signal domain-containing protein [Longimicrobiales bacterium]